MGEVFNYLFLEYLLSRKAIKAKNNFKVVNGIPITAITKVIISKSVISSPPFSNLKGFDKR